MTTIKGIAPQKTLVEFDGTVEELINLAEQMSEGLDSHDLGDAMGFFIFHAAMYNDFEMKCDCPEQHTLRVTVEFENFIWEGTD